MRKRELSIAAVFFLLAIIAFFIPTLKSTPPQPAPPETSRSISGTWTIGGDVPFRSNNRDTSLSARRLQEKREDNQRERVRISRESNPDGMTAQELRDARRFDSLLDRQLRSLRNGDIIGDNRNAANPDNDNGNNAALGAAGTALLEGLGLSGDEDGGGIGTGFGGLLNGGTNANGNDNLGFLGGGESSTGLGMFGS